MLGSASALFIASPSKGARTILFDTHFTYTPLNKVCWNWVNLPLHPAVDHQNLSHH